MAARFWCWLLGCEAVLAAALCAVLWVLLPVSAQAAAAIALAAACCAPATLVAASFVASWMSMPRRPTLRGFGYLLRALLTEAVDFNITVFAMASTPRVAHRAASIDTPVRDRPLLLIHGILCNRGVWEPWLQRLQSARFGPIRLLDLEPPLADIEVHARRVERELRSLSQEGGGRPVDIIAHSMGGLVARAALRRTGPGVIGRVITIGTPHYGTRLARLFPWPPFRQMRPGSAWLRGLNDTQGSSAGTSLTCIYSLEDNLVVPACNAALKYAQLTELRGIGHVGLLSSRRVIECALASLRPG